MTAKEFWDKFRVHLAVYLAVSIVMTIVGLFIGYHAGVAKGEKLATDVATNIAGKAANTAAGLLTTEFINQEIERRFKSALEEREKIGYEKGRSAAGSHCALEDYYRIIRDYILQGKSIRSNKDAMVIAQNISRVRTIGNESIGDMAGKVLNGALTELEDARKRGDADRVMQILKEISETLPARDRSFQIIKDKLATAK